MVLLTGAGGVGLVLVVAAVVGSVAQPAFGDAAVVAAFELISRAAVIVYETQHKNRSQFPRTQCFPTCSTGSNDTKTKQKL